MGKSKQSREREAAKAERRRQKRKARPKPPSQEKPQYGVALAGIRPGNEALAHPSLKDSKMTGLFLTPLATMSEMILLGGPEGVLDRFHNVLQAPVLFVLGAYRNAPGKWTLLVGGQKMGPLTPARQGVCLDDQTFGPPDEFDYLVEIMEGVASQFGKSARTVATDLIDATISDAITEWPEWAEWAAEHRPDIQPGPRSL
jgi:hypothetical protein